MGPEQCNRLLLNSPVLSLEDFNAIRQIQKAHKSWGVSTIDLTFPKSNGFAGYSAALDEICAQAVEALAQDNKIIILSDRNTSADRVAVSALAACGAVHHHLVKNRLRSKVAIVVETAEAREVHHLCVLLGYGADAICP